MAEGDSALSSGPVERLTQPDFGGGDRAVRGSFLVLYDYRTGGAWAYLLAESREQIRERFPDLEVVDERPAWLTDEEDRLLRQRMTIDIDDSEDRFLRALLHRQEGGGGRPDERRPLS